MHLLIIEDEAAIANSLAIFLKNRGYSLEIASSGEEALEFKDFKKYSLLICDYLLPGINGQDLVKEIRKDHKSIPIIMLSAISDNLNKVKLINSGADDYLAKPFAGDELVARIKALLRRKKHPPKQNLSFADLSLDLERGEALRGGENIYLTNRESAILKYLMENASIICPRRLIIENAWDEATCHLSNTIESHILKLRKKIDFKKPKLIYTVKGRGYKIDLKD